MSEYHIEGATEADQTVVRNVFASAASRFGLVDTILSCRQADIICNYSEGLGWGFGLGALRVGSIICVGLNPAKASPQRYQPVFEFIIIELKHAFGERVSLVSKEKEIDYTKLPLRPISEEMRAFARKLLERDRSKDITG
jgi:hypothetical protein